MAMSGLFLRIQHGITMIKNKESSRGNNHGLVMPDSISQLVFNDNLQAQNPSQALELNTPYGHVPQNRGPMVRPVPAFPHQSAIMSDIFFPCLGRPVARHAWNRAIVRKTGD
ncbi:LOW QUALITY PROTEIN: hypothetical protein GX48_05719 [Paracoccidioides brasiliensis]|nr:LOW QUALITY PROTEIN: hypothetical protein GX48_05719 [Paracoccidioides brasiliensis]